MKISIKTDNLLFKAISGIFFTLSLLLILYARHGYVYGASDQSETLPYVLWLKNNALYPTDFFIQNLIARSFNERRFFAEWLKLFAPYLKYGVFFLHALCTSALLWGIWLYTRERYENSDLPLEIKDEFAEPRIISANSKSEVWIAILVPLLFLYNINTGSVELYENTFNPSYLANVLALGVFILHDYRKTFWAVVLLTIITFLQPLIGALLALVFFLSETTFLTLASLQTKNRSETIRLLGCYAFYCSTAGVYLWALSNQVSSSADPNVAMRIIEMRAPHHYFPDQFSLAGYAFMLACVVAIFKYGSLNEHLWTFFILLGCVLYCLGVYYFESYFILNTQFFRITLLIKLWGTLAITRWLFIYLENDTLMQFIEKNFKRIIIFAGVFSFLIILPPFRIFKNKDYMFPFLNNTDAKVEIAVKAKNATPIDALFVTPPDFDAFRFYSERSNFVDFKAILHDNNYLSEWQKRLKTVYNIGIENTEKGFQLIPVAKINFNNLSDAALKKICLENKINYIIRDKLHPILGEFVKVDSTKDFDVYKISPAIF